MSSSNDAMPPSDVRHDEARSEELPLALLDGSRSKAIIRHRGWLVRRMLVLADIVGLTLAFVLADSVIGADIVDEPNLNRELIAFVVGLGAWVIVAKLAGLYDRDE